MQIGFFDEFCFEKKAGIVIEYRCDFVIQNGRTDAYSECSRLYMTR